MQCLRCFYLCLDITIYSHAQNLSNDLILHDNDCIWNYAIPCSLMIIFFLFLKFKDHLYRHIQYEVNFDSIVSSSMPKWSSSSKHYNAILDSDYELS